MRSLTCMFVCFILTAINGCSTKENQQVEKAQRSVQTSSGTSNNSQSKPVQQGAAEKALLNEKRQSSIFSFWQQTQESQMGFLGIEPKTEEVIIICKNGIMDGYVGLGIPMLQKDISVSQNKITFKDTNRTLLYEVSGDILIMKTGDGKVMKYKRLIGSLRKKFIAAVKEGGVEVCPVDD
ncbi:MAG: hypothetical protein LAO04_22350 [Acidobacteriia bacterium]|nr:hypothetical protein [Terriglobia bacterium]